MALLPPLFVAASGLAACHSLQLLARVAGTDGRYSCLIFFVDQFPHFHMASSNVFLLYVFECVCGKLMLTCFVSHLHAQLPLEA